MPWELGRCSFGAGQRHVDVSKVIWLGTSNIGHDLVFEHQTQRVEPTAAMSREEYVDLMGLLRPQVSDRLGVSIYLSTGCNGTIDCSLAYRDTSLAAISSVAGHDCAPFRAVLRRREDGDCRRGPPISDGRGDSDAAGCYSGEAGEGCITRIRTC